MNLTMKYGLIVGALIFLILITYILKKGRMPIKYALVWYCGGIIILLSGLFPVLITKVSKLLGFEVLSSMIMAVLILILILISIVLTIIVAGQTVKIRLLIQEVSMLKERVDKSDK